MTIIATFTGTPSLGYKTGKKYELTIANTNGVKIVRSDGTGECEYNSLSSFFRNWNSITVLTIEEVK